MGLYRDRTADDVSTILYLFLSSLEGESLAASSIGHIYQRLSDEPLEEVYCIQMEDGNFLTNGHQVVYR